MANIFQSILVNKPKRSVFDLSYENKLSLDMGDLVPIYMEHVVPGDKFRVNSEVFLRFAPMVFPVMHRVNCTVHYFFVPLRLIWEDFQEFITGGENGTSQPVLPRRKLNPSSSAYNFRVGSLADYLGYNYSRYSDITVSSADNPEVSILPFRAYQFIYNEYYRDQNLTPEVQFSLGSGDNSTFLNLVKGTSFPNTSEGAALALQNLTLLRRRAWEKDYFTSALPWVQRGVASQLPVSLDLSKLKLEAPTPTTTGATFIGKAFMSDGSTPPGDDIYIRTDGSLTTGGKVMTLGSPTGVTGSHTHQINNSTLSAVRITQDEDGVVITPPTINELRLAEHIQRWLERNARGGARYIEQILSHFGVRVPDYRLDRPEYLGGGKAPVVISEVLQTSSTDDTSPQGSMAGHAYSVGNKNKFKYSFDEHGIVLGIMSVLPRTTYQQGLSRHLLKSDKFDFYWPEFAHLGEQAVMNCELYNNPVAGNLNDGIFGYQERYAEYKYRSGEVHGDFKTSLDAWHLGRKFSLRPYLNTSFVQSDPSNRIFASDSGQHLWCQVYNSVRAVRPMPKHAIPSL